MFWSGSGVVSGECLEKVWKKYSGSLDIEKRSVINSHHQRFPQKSIDLVCQLCPTQKDRPVPLYHETLIR